MDQYHQIQLQRNSLRVVAGGRTSVQPLAASERRWTHICLASWLA